MSRINILSISSEIGHRWMLQDLTDNKSTLVQVMTWAVRQQAITGANIDPNLWGHEESLGHNELTARGLRDV